MSDSKFYAVRIGRVPGVYRTWEQAKQQTEGFSGADFKSFATEEEAASYIEYDDYNEHRNDNVTNSDIDKQINNIQEGDVIAFVDGSYSKNENDEKYSFGVILITNDNENALYKAYINREYMESKNVAGEIEGVKQAILWSIANNKTRIKIFYDYEGIEKWATKEWCANVLVSQHYVEFLDEYSNKIKIEFEHVKAHSGITYNEKADQLAKKALLSQGYKTYDDGSVYIVGFDSNDWIKIINEIEKEISDDSEEKVIFQVSTPKDYLEKITVSFKNQKLIINCYKNNKSYVQGKQNELFRMFISFAIDKLPSNNQVIEVLNCYHALSISKYEVKNAFALLMPDYRDDNEIKIRNTLLSAVFNTLLTGYMPDYTCLVTPLFRSFEFYLHKILNNQLGNSTTNQRGCNNFSFFNLNSSNGLYEYNGNINNLSNVQINFLNDLYNRYNRIRHPYSHWCENAVDTHVITDIKTARDLITDGLNFLNEYYIKF